MLNTLNSSIHLRNYTEIAHTHAHDFCQWVLPLHGVLEMQIDSKIDKVSAQQAAFIAANTKHCYASEGNNLFLVIDAPKIEDLVSAAMNPSFWQLNPALQHYLQFMRYAIEENDYSAIVNQQAQELLLNLLSQQFLQLTDTKAAFAKSWIEQNYQQAISCKQIASQCYLSSSQLQRRFKLAIGQGIAEYWRYIRLQHAKRLLATSSLSISNIAEVVGYQSHVAFTRAFQQHFQLSPRQYARNSKNIAANS